jgi:hypothetical protein
MRTLIICLLLLGCASQEQFPIDTQEYVFHMRSGQSFMRVLPADWEPKYEGGFMRIDPRHRVMAMDIMLIEPRIPLEVTNMRMVRLLRRMPPTQNRTTYELWVPADTGRIIGDDPPNDLVQVAPHTWLRPNEFRIQFDRDPATKTPTEERGAMEEDR